MEAWSPATRLAVAALVESREAAKKPRAATVPVVGADSRAGGLFDEGEVAIVEQRRGGGGAAAVTRTTEREERECALYAVQIARSREDPKYRDKVREMGARVEKACEPASKRRPKVAGIRYGGQPLSLEFREASAAAADDAHSVFDFNDIGGSRGLLSPSLEGALPPVLLGEGVAHAIALGAAGFPALVSAVARHFGPGGDERIATIAGFANSPLVWAIVTNPEVGVHLRGEQIFVDTAAPLADMSTDGATRVLQDIMEQAAELTSAGVLAAKGFGGHQAAPLGHTNIVAAALQVREMDTYPAAGRMVALCSDARAHISLSPAGTFAQLLLALAVATGNLHMKPRVIA